MSNVKYMIKACKKRWNLAKLTCDSMKCGKSKILVLGENTANTLFYKENENIFKGMLTGS